MAKTLWGSISAIYSTINAVQQAIPKPKQLQTNSSHELWSRVCASQVVLLASASTFLQLSVSGKLDSPAWPQPDNWDNLLLHHMLLNLQWDCLGMLSRISQRKRREARRNVQAFSNTDCVVSTDIRS